MVKTSVNISDELWKKFSIAVIEDYGGRKKTDVVTDLIEQYLAEQEKAKKK